MTSQKKLDQREKLVNFLRDFPNFALIKFDKTTHQNLETLRKQLKTADAQIKVVKNTIFEKALLAASLKQKEIGKLKEKILPLKDSTAIIGLSENWSKSLNAFSQFLQKEKTLSFKAGILDKISYLSDDLLKIAKLASKEVLFGKIIASFKSPVSRTVYSIKFSVTKLVLVLNAKAKGGEDK